MFARVTALAAALLFAAPFAATAQPLIQVTTGFSNVEAHPIAVASAPLEAAVHVVGGGARVDFTGNGSLLFNSSPAHGTRDWVSQAKDHLVSDPAQLTSYALFFDDPGRLYEVRTFYSASSEVSRTPSARVSVPAGWVLSGGGCSVDWRSAQGPGAMLTGSYPDVQRARTATTWVCEARDMGGANPADVIAVAIGVRPAPGAPVPAPRQCITAVTSPAAAHPVAQAPTCGGGQITGGGARAVAFAPSENAGQLLTATYPLPGRAGGASAWEARSKDHSVSSPGTVTAYAISLRF